MKKRVLSIIMVCATLLSLLPSIASAKNESTSKGESVSVPYIISEDISKRDTFEKHFLCSDGSYVAVSYAEAVHYQDKITGEWKDTDSTLSFDAETKMYKTQSGDFTASFASSIKNAKTVQLSLSDGYAISWKLTADSRTAEQKLSKTTNTATFRDATPIIDEVFLAKTSKEYTSKNYYIDDSDSFSLNSKTSIIEYKNITGNTQGGLTLKYSVSQNRIEEDIIIEDKTGIADYIMEMDIGDLTAILLKDNSVIIVDENNEMQYTVGVPYMCDAEYNVSYAITVTVEQNGSSCKITYSPDRDWLNAKDRAYPVLLDPTITNREYQCNITDTYVTQADTANHSGEQNSTIGIRNGYLNRMYFKIENLPTLDVTTVPTSAKITYNHGSGTTTGRAMSMHKVTSSWNASTIKYSTQPTYNSTATSTCSFNTTNVYFTIPANDLIEMYNSTSYGYVVKYTSESMTNPDYNVLRTMEYSTASQKPLLVVTYNYTLPGCFNTYDYYKIQNVASSKYLQVYNSSDADGTNIIQYSSSTSTGQQFILIQNTSTGGYQIRPLCSTTRVIDSVTTSGYVANGGNVQLSTQNTGSTSQDWLIVFVGSSTFKIVSRANPSLALTSYGTGNGTSTGKTTTSTGNVFLRTYTGTDNQHWCFYYNNGFDYIPISYDTGISIDSYYINNFVSRKFIHQVIGSGGPNNVKSDVFASGTNAYLKWDLKFLYYDSNYAYYTISCYNEYYLNATSNTSVGILMKSGGVIPNSCVWKVYNVAAKQIIQNREYGTYLYQQNDTSGLSLTSSITDRAKWLFLSVSSYKCLEDFAVNDITINMDSGVLTKTAVITNKIPTNAFQCSVDDYLVSIVNGSAHVVRNAMTFTANSTGVTEVKIVHKPTGITRYFNVIIIKDDDPPIFYPPPTSSNGVGLVDVRYIMIPDPSIQGIPRPTLLDPIGEHDKVEWLLETMLYSRNMNKGVDILQVDFDYRYDGNIMECYSVVQNKKVPLVEYIRYSKLAIISGHGDANGNGICTNASNDNIKLTTDYILSLPNDYFSYTQCVFLNACSQMKDQNQGNLAEAFLARGAQSVLGYNTDILVTASHAFEFNFMNYLRNDVIYGVDYYNDEPEFIGANYHYTLRLAYYEAKMHLDDEDVRNIIYFLHNDEVTDGTVDLREDFP